MIRVGITQGDINGIGWEIIIKTFSEPAMLDFCTPVIFGSNRTASLHRKALGIEEFNFNVAKDYEQLTSKRANILTIYEEEVQLELGKETATGGKYALKSLEAATESLKQGKIDVLVTAPINKHNIQSETFNFPGHTEYLEKHFSNDNSLMILCADNLRVALVTGHVPVSTITHQLTSEKIVHKLQILNQSLIRDFGIRKPKIAVLGLNPHAGDNGTIGTEEQTLIIPAINQMKAQNPLIYGPYAADGFFGNGAYLKFDAILAMYHDQGLAPFKALSFGSGVNYTAGLSIVRTSPDHGTGFDIAGKNLASADSFRKAVYMAVDVFRKRNEYDALNENPLPVTQLKRER
jgi:4-hydroxythreonine-4-phosphate dehydrogenase